MAELLKRVEIPILITAIAGLTVVLSYFLDIPILDNFAGQVTTWGVIVYSMSVGLGIVNFCIIHGKNIQERKTGQWPHSIWLIFGIFFMIIVGLWSGVPWGGKTPMWTWLYTWINIPSGQVLFSLFGFYVISAAIHAFRARGIEATLMLISCLIVFMWMAPIGGIIWSGFPTLGNWISSVPTGAAFRGVTICMGLGIISLAIRIFIGRERAVLGGE